MFNRNCRDIDKWTVNIFFAIAAILFAQGSNEIFVNVNNIPFRGY